MDRSEVELEDPEKRPQDSTNNTKESEDKLYVANVETEGKESLPIIASENGREDPTDSRSDADGQCHVNSKMNDLMNKSDSEDPINRKDEVRYQISSESRTEDQINTKSEAEDHANAKHIVGTNDEYKIDSQIYIGGGLQEEKPTKNSLESGYSVKNLMDGEKPTENASSGKNAIGRDDTNPRKGVQEKMPTEHDDVGRSVFGSEKLSTESFENEAFQTQRCAPDEVPQFDDEEMEDLINTTKHEHATNEIKEGSNKAVPVNAVTGEHAKSGQTVSDCEINGISHRNHQEIASMFGYSTAKAGYSGDKTFKSVYSQAKMAESDEGTPEDQAAFMKELEMFHRGNSVDFKPPKFYSQPLNCLKLWRAVMRLGGYDKVCRLKLWRQVGESFHPPKTCTTVSWTFRIFYEKALLDYEKHKIQSGEVEPVAAVLPEASVIDNEGNGYEGSGSGLGRARRDAAARAMQGWHVQRLFDCGDVSETILNDKNVNSMARREKNLKTIGSLKQKRPNDVEYPVKAARTEAYKQVVTTVVDVGPPADWVKINIRQTKDCFEIYALVPGLSREEVRVQSDPGGRLVITGEPEQPDSPWGTTPFKKVVSLPARINPHMSSAVVSMHGRLFIRVPFEHPEV